jgi:hypothetical protein
MLTMNHFQAQAELKRDQAHEVPLSGNASAAHT